jgi:MoaA/NifB/PqqE/SkfB family radical SAM enzyme
VKPYEDLLRAYQDAFDKDDPVMSSSIDIEPTNRCNAKCHFCPRDQTPHQGLMSPEVFTQSLRRATEYRDLALELLGEDVAISLCGLGEPLLNRHTPEFVRQAREAGFAVAMSSNGALLNEERGKALLDAGLQRILINVGAEGSDYESVYQLPFEKTRANVVRFVGMAEPECAVQVVLVDYQRDPAHMREMERYWKQYGVNSFVRFDVMNRGGALFVDHMQFEEYSQLAKAREMLASRGAAVPLCGAPFGYLFIGYDGQYYLCCSDWKKETPMGSVFDESFRSVIDQKLQYVVSRSPVCKTCNHDPINKLTDALKAVDDGAAEPGSGEQMLDAILSDNNHVHEILDKLGAPVPDQASPPRPRIPIRVE